MHMYTAIPWDRHIAYSTLNAMEVSYVRMSCSSRVTYICPVTFAKISHSGPRTVKKARTVM